MSNNLHTHIVKQKKRISPHRKTHRGNVGIEACDENLAFFSIVSHNIKNPFASLLGFSELLFDDFDDLNDEERKFYLSEIKKSATCTFNYVEKFFEWIYYKTGKVKLNFADVKLKNCVINVLNKINHIYTENKSISIDIDEDIIVYADENSIEKVLFNIIENAIKFSNSNPSIKISAKKNEGKVEIVISDNGIGIKKEDLAKILNLSEDPSLIGENDNKGSGISLILSKELIELNNGIILIESEFSSGSTFSIILEGK